MTIITRPSVTAKRLRALTWPDKYWSQYSFKLNMIFQVSKTCKVFVRHPICKPVKKLHNWCGFHFAPKKVSLYHHVKPVLILRGWYPFSFSCLLSFIILFSGWVGEHLFPLLWTSISRQQESRDSLSGLKGDGIRFFLEGKAILIGFSPGFIHFRNWRRIQPSL